jgi:DNA polymerase III alpha subunit (gram-positive type)
MNQHIKDREIYCSTDIETNGPIPGPNSMLSFGSVAFIVENDEIKQLGKFYANLELLEGSKPDPGTEEFWQKNKEAYELTRENTKHPQLAMQQYHSWLKELPGTPVFVGYPATFDFMFVYWYLMQFVGDSPFSFSALDIKTFAMAIMQTPYRKSTKRNMPKRWFDKNTKHTHHALDDATEQGMLFCNMLIENLKKR